MLPLAPGLRRPSVIRRRRVSEPFPPTFGEAFSQWVVKAKRRFSGPFVSEVLGLLFVTPHAISSSVLADAYPGSFEPDEPVPDYSEFLGGTVEDFRAHFLSEPLDSASSLDGVIVLRADDKSFETNIIHALEHATSVAASVRAAYEDEDDY